MRCQDKVGEEGEREKPTKNLTARPPYDAAFSNKSAAVLNSNNAAGATFDCDPCVTTDANITYKIHSISINTRTLRLEKKTKTKKEKKKEKEREREKNRKKTPKTHSSTKRMRPQHPKPRNLRREQPKLRLHSPNNRTRTPIPRQKRRRILALDRIERVARQRMRKEASMDVQQGFAVPISSLIHSLDNEKKPQQNSLNSR